MENEELSEENQVPKCPICGEDMFETEEGKLQCPSLVYHEMDPRMKKFFKGQWLGLPNIDVKMLWEDRPISENRPLCPTCKKKVSGRAVELAVGHHHISYAAYPVNRSGEHKQKLIELYRKIRKRKINLEEAFRIETELRREYYGKPKAERPISQTQGYVPLKCPSCAKPLGTVKVTVTESPSEAPEPPSYREYIMLPRTPEQERLVKERFAIPEKMSFKEWLQGKDVKPFIGKLEKMKEEITKLPYMRNLVREVSNLNALIYTTIEKLQEEIRLRPDAVYALLKSPPKPM